MVKAAGAIFLSKNSNRVLMNLRADHVKAPRRWGFLGGKIHKDEKILKGLSRELREEMGFVPNYIKVLPLDVFRMPGTDFEYYSFLVIVEKEFVPKINHESGGWGWFDLECLPRPLHGGAHAVLNHPNFRDNLDSILNNLED